MHFQVDVLEMKKHMLRLIIGAGLLSLILQFFGDRLIKFNYDESFDMMLNASYHYVSAVYILTCYQFIFATMSVKLRFDVLNGNIT
jgi:hypothetical protein